MRNLTEQDTMPILRIENVQGVFCIDANKQLNFSKTNLPQQKSLPIQPLTETAYWIQDQMRVHLGQNPEMQIVSFETIQLVFRHYDHQLLCIVGTEKMRIASLKIALNLLTKNLKESSTS